MIARSRPRTADIRRDRRAELQEPPPDRLVGCVNTSLGQQFLDIPKGQREPGIEPDRVADDFWREAVALKRYRFHPMMLIAGDPQSYLSYRDIALWRHCQHSHPGWTAPSIRPDMIFGKDTCYHPGSTKAHSKLVVEWK